MRSRKILYCKTGNFKVKQGDMCNARAVYGTGLLITFDGYTSAYSMDKLSPVPFSLGFT